MSTPIREAISPEQAQRKVSQFVIIAIGDRLFGGDPEEVYDDQANRSYWLVPVILTLRDEEFRLGEILVDSETGRLQIQDQTVDDIIAKAKRAANSEVSRSPAKYSEHNAT